MCRNIRGDGFFVFTGCEWPISTEPGARMGLPLRFSSRSTCFRVNYEALPLGAWEQHGWTLYHRLLAPLARGTSTRGTVAAGRRAVVSTRTPTATPRSWNSAMRQMHTGTGRRGNPRGPSRRRPAGCAVGGRRRGGGLGARCRRRRGREGRTEDATWTP